MTQPPDNGADGRASLDTSDWSPPTPPQRRNRRTSARSSWTPCRAPGCTATVGKAKTWGLYCSKHDINNRRWGHPCQTMLMVRELDPYLTVVKRIRERNKGTNWSAVHARWRALVGDLRDFLTQVRMGRPHVGYRRQAAELIVQIADTVEEARVVDLVLAVYLAEEFEPGRIKSDEAFRACLLHAVRREAGAGRRFNLKRGDRTKASYRVLGQKVRETAAQWLVEALGLVGLHVARQERARVTAQEETTSSYKDAVWSIG